MESVVDKVKAFSQAEVSARMEEVSAYLKEQMRARETLDRLRNSSELEIRKCHVKEREELQASSCAPFPHQHAFYRLATTVESGNL